jgi:hypothetical protein
VEKNNFKIIFHDKNNKEIDLDYQLYDSPVASKWFKKIKHLKNIPIDKIESEQENVSDLQKIYNELCLFAGIQPKTFSKIDQALLNEFHKLYEYLHDVLYIKKNRGVSKTSNFISFFLNSYSIFFISYIEDIFNDIVFSITGNVKLLLLFSCKSIFG